MKKTVNFDNHHVYHFYYGDERGTPGTIWTTFPYKGTECRLDEREQGQSWSHLVLGAGRLAWLLERATVVARHRVDDASRGLVTP